MITKYCSAIIALQLIGVWLSGSFSLLSDTFHVVIDLAAVLVAQQVARAVRVNNYQTTNPRSIGALLHAILLAVAAWLIIKEGVNKLSQPNAIVSEYLLIAALLGGYLNWRQHRILHMMPEKDNDTFWWMNLHILSDLGGNLAVVTASIVIFFTGYFLADAITSFVIAGLMIFALLVYLYRKIKKFVT